MSTFTERDHARLATLFDGVVREPERAKAWRDCAVCHGYGARANIGPCEVCTNGQVPDREPYAGYRPAVAEAPNGDTKDCRACEGQGGDGGSYMGQWEWPCEACNGTGRVPNVDAGRAGKRFLHVALKYDPPAWAVEYLARAHWEACRVATALGVPAAYRPHEADGTLRVLEYPSAAHEGNIQCDFCGERSKAYGGTAVSADVCPARAPGAGTAEHTDFDLFSIVLWRSHPADLELGYECTARTIPEAFRDNMRLAAGRALNPGLHIGEIGALVGLGPATPHRVPARPYAQKSLIYFAMPDHGARLPCPAPAHGGWPSDCTGGPTVGQWLAERLARSRY